MKRRNREINVFSMSALDLFASALGAFILLAIVIFPYFPNTARVPALASPTPPAPPAPDLQPQLEEVRRQLADTQRQLVEARNDAVEPEALRDRLADAEEQLAESQSRLADAEADAAELDGIHGRLAVAEEQLAEARELGDSLQEALAEERRRKFLLVTISWDRNDDVDLHVVDPRGNEYYYAERRYAGSPARFEEDTVAGPGNEVWLHPRVEPGEYAVHYRLFNKRSNSVDVRGSVVHSHGREELRTTRLQVQGNTQFVASVVVDGEGNVQVR